MTPPHSVSEISGDRQQSRTMKAIVQTAYGSAEVLKLETVDQPVMPGATVPDDKVLVRVYASSINAGDWHLMRGTPFLIRFIFGGIFRPKIKTLGCDVAGRVEAVGRGVTQFQPGDEVFGELSACGFGAFAEYVCVPATALALKPVNASFEAAAAVPTSALTALQGLRDIGQIQPGQRVLITGASGGVGSFAVQIAKAFGAQVTALCSPQKMDRVRSLGADQVIDSSQVDITQAGQRYDVIFDAAAYRSVFDYFSILPPQGTYIMVGGSTTRLFQVMLLGGLIARWSHRTVKCLVQKSSQADLIALKDLIEAGAIAPCLDRCYELSEIATAISALEQRQVQGKVAIRMGQSA
ncbi:MAG TPA: NAD(P)-dependent alcohol dehydrogenase [Chroococcidiopsis sp.]